MPVVLPLVAVGVAILALLVAYAAAALLAPPLEGLAREVPVVGGYIARGVAGAVNYAKGKIHSWAVTLEHTLVGWLVTLAERLRTYVTESAAFARSVVDSLDQLAHVTVHEIVKAFVNPVRELAADAHSIAANALDRVGSLGRDLERELQGIEGTLQRDLDRLHDVITNVDLPALERTLDRELTRGLDRVEGAARAGDHVLEGEINRLIDWTNSIPLADLLALLAAFPLVAALVRALEAEAGLGNPACRAKVKQICSTDPRAWEEMLGLLIAGLAWPGLEVMLELADELFREIGVPIVDLVYRG